MALASLFNVPVDPQSISRWAFANQNEHWKIVAAAKAQLGVKLAAYALDPIPLHDRKALGAWLYNHQTMHGAMDAALGIPSNDFTTFDFSSIASLSSQIQLHAEEHVTAALKLGLT